MSDPFQRAKEIRAGEHELPMFDELTGWLERAPKTWLPALLVRVVALCFIRKVFVNQTALECFIGKHAALAATGTGALRETTTEGSKQMNKIRKGTKVSWLAEGATVRGHGVTISDEENGRVLVAVDGGVLDTIPTAYHMVIYCTVTWLTVEA